MTRLVNSLNPQNSKMLIRPDERSKVYGHLTIPETVIDQVRCRSGHILKVGSSVKPQYRPGMRVLYAVHSATSTGPDEIGMLDILDDSEVSALTDDKEKGECDEGWIEHLRAPPGMLLVERDEQRELVGSIILPDSYKAKVRSSRAIVVATSVESVYEVGDWVMLSAGATRSFTMDALSQRQLVRIYPGQILCKIDVVTEDPLRAETNSGGLREELLAELDQDHRFDAGSMEGLQ